MPMSYAGKWKRKTLEHFYSNTYVNNYRFFLGRVPAPAIHSRSCWPLLQTCCGTPSLNGSGGHRVLRLYSACAAHVRRLRLPLLHSNACQPTGKRRLPIVRRRFPAEPSASLHLISLRPLAQPRRKANVSRSTFSVSRLNAPVIRHRSSVLSAL